MDAHPRYAFVGVILSVLFAGLILWGSWLWRAGAKDQTSFYLINFRRQSLAGLQIDGLVTMRGLRIGSIKKIQLDSHDVEGAWVTVVLNKNIPIKQDARAVINRNLLTGLASIDLVGASNSAALVEVGTKKYPQIAEGEGGFDHILQQLPNTIAKASSLLEQASLILSDKNIQLLEKSLANFELVSNQLLPLVTTTTSGVDSLKVFIADLSKNLTPLLIQLAQTSNTANQSLQSVSQDFAALSKALTLASNNLKEPRSSIFGLPVGQLGPGEQEYVD